MIYNHTILLSNSISFEIDYMQNIMHIINFKWACSTSRLDGICWLLDLWAWHQKSKREAASSPCWRLWNYSWLLGHCLFRHFQRLSAGGWGWLPNVVCKLVGNGMVQWHVMKVGEKFKPSFGWSIHYWDYCNFSGLLRLFSIIGII